MNFQVAQMYGNNDMFYGDKNLETVFTKRFDN